MAKYNNKVQNMLLALGILFFLIGIVLSFVPSVAQFEFYPLLLRIFFLLLTAAFVYFSLLTKNSVLFYISLNLCIISLISLIFAIRAVPMSFKQYCPLIVIIFGITLFPVGRIHYKRFRTIYVFPSAALTILGLFFFLFAFGIIKVPMRVFFKNFLPIFLIVCGIFLIVLYYLRQNVNDKFPDIKDKLEKDYDDYESEDY